MNSPSGMANGSRAGTILGTSDTGERFEFDLSDNVCDVERCIIHDCTLTWLCQSALQNKCREHSATS